VARYRSQVQPSTKAVGASWRCPRPRRLDGDHADLELAGEDIVTWRGKGGYTGNREHYRDAT